MQRIYFIVKTYAMKHPDKGQDPNWDVTNTFITVSFLWDTCIEQILLIRWAMTCFFYGGCFCDLQKRVLNPKLYKVVDS